MNNDWAIMGLRGVGFKYDREYVISKITLDLPKGKKIVILGPNGAGKTTLLYVMCGLLKPQEGEVFFKGKKIGFSRNELKEFRTKVGIVMQNPDVNLICPLVAQDVAYGPTNLGFSPGKVRERVEEALSAVGMLGMREQVVHELSFGQKQRVALAGVLAMKPEVILLDEPTAGLDHKGATSFFEALECLVAEGTTIVMSTHDIDLAWSWADYFILINKGEKIWEGDFAELSKYPELLAKAELGFPHVVRFFLLLKEKGLFLESMRVPRNMEELASMMGISEVSKERCFKSFGWA